MIDLLSLLGELLLQLKIKKSKYMTSTILISKFYSVIISKTFLHSHKKSFAFLYRSGRAAHLEIRQI